MCETSAKPASPAWERELAALHATLPPRSGEPLRRLMRAPLSRWWLHSALGFAAVIAIGGGAFAWAVDGEFTRAWGRLRWGCC